MEQELDNFYAALLALYREGAGTAAYGMLWPPDDLGDFLNRLARPDERLSPLAQQLGSSVEELGLAAYAFIRQCLFTPDNNHYQVLGLPPDASAGMIRQRYRMLIGLFHPDRITRSEPWVEQAVRYLNTAYAELKRPDKRRIYDQRLQKDSGCGASRRPSSAMRRKPSVKVPPRPVDALYRIAPLQRNPRAFVWLTIILVLVLMLLVAMNSGPSTSLMLVEDGLQESGMDVVNEVPARPSILEQPLSASQEPAVKIPRGVAGPHAVAASASVVVKNKMDEIITVDQNESRVVAHEQGEQRKDTGGVTAAHAVAASSRKFFPRAEEPPAVLFDGMPPLRVDRLPGVVHAAKAVVASETGAMAKKPEFLFMRYIQAWEKGDLETLLGLFTLDGKVNGNQGRERIGQGYRRMFEATSSRKFKLEQLKIVPLSGHGYRAWARIAARAEATVGGRETRFQGDMILDLVPKGRRLYIASMRHNIQARD